MVFSEPVYIDDNNMLVPAGVPIRQKDIEKLKAWGISTVKTNGHPSMEESEKEPEKEKETDPEVPKSLAAKQNQSAIIRSLSSSKDKKSAHQIYISLIEQMNTVFLSVLKNENVFDSRMTNAISTSLLQALKNEPNKFIGFILGSEIEGYEMAKSSVNTAVLSALCAKELKLPYHKILNIIIGALLHDIGMLRLPKLILEKKGSLSDIERRLMNSHSLFSQRIAMKEFGYHDDVGNIVLQHHERWDGGGYPFHVAGDSIDIGARIVSISDAFEAMVSPKPYRSPIIGYQAMKNLLSDNSRRFDPELLKVFIMTMGIHPVGSIVQLNNGLIGRISDVRSTAPLRPKIQIIADKDKKYLKSDERDFIDLLTEKNLFIAKALEAKELSELHE